MRFETDISLGGPSAPSVMQARSWLLTGPDPLAMERLALALSRFGIRAQPVSPACSQASVAARHSPVLCDARLRPVAKAWLDDLPWRTAPVVVFGVGAASVRAQMIRCGADDAVSGRVAPPELAARMHAAVRARAAAQGIVQLAGFEIDIAVRQVRRDGVDIPLMPREFDLLLVLARHAGEPIGRDALLRQVWRTAFDPGTNSLEVHIFKLRRSLASLGEAVRIETVRGQGYRLICAAVSQA